MSQRDKIKQYQKIVVKIGTSSLAFPTGRLNFHQIEKLAKVLSSLQKNGRKIILVSSGAIAAGAGRLGLKEKPSELTTKQALSALGQTELIKIYQKIFKDYNQQVAQILLTKDVMTQDDKNTNAKNTLHHLLELNIIPIINENDTISTFEIEFGDNDTLSANVATLINADLLILMSDIDGLYTADPKANKDAKIIPIVTEIDQSIFDIATGAGSSFGTGGMSTKINAAKLCANNQIDTMIVNGENPEILHQVFEGEKIGTLFTKK